MSKILIIAVSILLLTVVFGQDEFFEPGAVIGGYGELHWNQAFDENGDQSKNTLDFHRFIIYYGYNWTEKWSFKSEVELEHNFVADGEGELELEQAFVNYHAGNWGFQGGVILPSVGIINEYHEPPLFLSVERPVYNKYIIPTTWFGNGFAFYGNMSGFNFRLAMLEDLNGDGFIDEEKDLFKGIRSGRGKGFKTSAESWTKNLSVSYTGINGLRIGGSLTLNDAPRNETYINDNVDTLAYSESIGVSLIEFNGKYNAKNIYAIFEYGKVNFTDNDYWVEESEILAEFKSSSGYYLDLGYNIGRMINCGKLITWVRLSNVSVNDKVSSTKSDIQRFGITWWPIDDVAFKMDYGTVTTENVATTEFNLGIGYKF